MPPLVLCGGTCTRGKNLSTGKLINDLSKSSETFQTGSGWPYGTCDVKIRLPGLHTRSRTFLAMNINPSFLQS